MEFNGSQTSFVLLQLSNEASDVTLIIVANDALHYEAKDSRQYWRCSTYMTPSLWTKLGIDR